MKRIRFLLDFEIESNACLDSDAKPKQVIPLEEGIEIHFSNLSVEPGVDRPLLSCQVIVYADDFSHAKTIGEKRLNEFLRVLAFTSNCSFEVYRLLRIVDWTKGISERDCHVYGDGSSAHLPYELLTDEIFNSAARLSEGETTPLLLNSLRWFSLGIRAKYLDEQFQNFWFTIELIAQIDKDTTKVADKCPQCRNPLYCETCQTHPTHRPYPKQYIVSLIDRILGEKSDGFGDVVSDIRNRLLHGEILEDSMNLGKDDFSVVVDRLGQIAWHALGKSLKIRRKENENGIKLSVLTTNRYSHDKLTVIGHTSYSCSNPTNPKYSDIPKPELQVTSSRSD